MNDKLDEEALFAKKNQQSERTMQIVAAIFAAVMLVTLYIFIFGD